MEINERNEMALREYLWLSHGHQGLYGDDGEMQCSACGLADYKRDDLNILIEKAIKARHEVNWEILKERCKKPLLDCEGGEIG